MSRPPLDAPPQDSAETRERLVQALHADLVGPHRPEADHSTEDAEAVEGEVLPLPPSRWYLTGFLASARDRHAEDDAEEQAGGDDELGAGDEVETDDNGDPDPESKRRGFFPSSVGMSLILPPGDPAGPDTITVTVSWADYGREGAEERPEGEAEPAEEDSPKTVWRRQPPRRETVSLPLDAREVRRALEQDPDLELRAFVQPSGLADGTRAVALFLVNERPPGQKGYQDESFIFQVGLIVRSSCGLVPRPDLRDSASKDWDPQVADLQYREVTEFAVGHGVAVTSAPDPEPATLRGGAEARVVRTTWLPRASVSRVVHRQVGTVETRMAALGDLADAAAVRAALRPLPEAYAAWIATQRTADVSAGATSTLAQQRQHTRDGLMDAAELARARIEAGIELLCSDAVVREAFTRANRAMAAAALKRSPERYQEPGQEPRWYLFQLAFILLNLEGVADDAHPSREWVELIFFPTGGGKTEAYLGLIATTLVLRRLRGHHRPDQGLGVGVLLRYTLRLLTLDQLSRAATLICALELQRREEARPRRGSPISRLGDGRFAIGLWVGRSATANTISQVARDMARQGALKASVFPLTECPWCGEAIQERSVELRPNPRAPEEVVVSCARWSCEFSARASGGDGLPVLFVDEQIYRELPSLVIATVDKYAMTPWRGEVGMLFGRVRARLGGRFFGTLDGPVPAEAEALPVGLPRPELIVQDELHLISGPLGTMTGLYETAIEHLTRYEGEDGRPRLPKIIASTATVREARRHVEALFGRKQTRLFPPAGIDPNETFFSQVSADDAGRDYLGVAASGRRMKQVLLRTYVALLAAAARWDSGKGGEPADPYLTLVGYFNSLRELGGMRRLVEDEVRTRCLSYAERVPVNHDGPSPHFGNRRLELPVELTSRESTTKIKQAKERLHRERSHKDGVDVVLASNMISVGVDIDRLGLMVVAGQPKTTAEYIQATSRVGRDHRRPGLVVTCFNLYKARDRSHYEHFCTYHASFYRRVEAGSLTPFSGPALERGLAGVLVG